MEIEKNVHPDKLDDYLLWFFFIFTLSLATILLSAFVVSLTCTFLILFILSSFLHLLVSPQAVLPSFRIFMLKACGDTSPGVNSNGFFGTLLGKWRIKGGKIFKDLNFYTLPAGKQNLNLFLLPLLVSSQAADGNLYVLNSIHLILILAPACVSTSSSSISCLRLVGTQAPA